ncbi:MBL fold metallo-hydrolase [Hymenobacter terrenus]|uniref:MBL fold metallo-hydrolase n=1 Tax=Hymenobacter terrenus TaxID=1629124 RepID=UPI000907F8B2|nr:MBL fold metallo-hydrolase [Hymenobacter terrenus]
MSTKIHHVNFGGMRAIPTDDNPTTICHCLILEDTNGLALVDAGLGLLEMQRPLERFGAGLLNGWGFTIDERLAAVSQLREIGIAPKDISHILMTHVDVDHAGGLRDFPNAQVHLLAEELQNLHNKNPRYVYNQFEHNPRFAAHGPGSQNWFGLEARPLALGFSSTVQFIPLKGHTLGHAGVAIEQDGRWVLHAGDTYYRYVEVQNEHSRVDATAAHSADDNAARLQSLAHLRRLRRDHASEVSFFSTHDVLEFKDEPDEPVVIMSKINLQATPQPA